MPAQLVYSSKYNIHAGWLGRLHPFDTKKYGRAFRLLREWGVIEPGRVWAPREVTEAELLLAHDGGYLASLSHPSVVARGVEVAEIATLEPRLVDRFLLRPMRFGTGGTLMSVELALEHGGVVNLSGGYHHACPDHAEGFCFYADAAIAILDARRRGLIERAMIIDLDAHQGNGTGRVFMEDAHVHIFDMYNASIYPWDDEAKAAIDDNVELDPGTDDDHYMGVLRERLPEAIDRCDPEIVIYNAGTDILHGDPVGMLGVSAEGVMARDRYVLELLHEKRRPWVMITSGGYTDASHMLIAAAARVGLTLE